MAIQFSNRMEQLKASEIREILKLTQQPDIIHLQEVCQP